MERDREPLAECALSLLRTSSGHFPDGVRDHKLPVWAQELGAFVMIAAERPIIEGTALEQIAPRIQAGVESVYACVTRSLCMLPAAHEPEAGGTVLVASIQAGYEVVEMGSPESFTVFLSNHPQEMVEGKSELLCDGAEVRKKEAVANSVRHAFALEGQCSEELPVYLVECVNLRGFHDSLRNQRGGGRTRGVLGTFGRPCRPRHASTIAA